MNLNPVVTAVAAGLTLAGYAYSKKSRETGKEPWDEKKDALEYDYIVLGGGTAGCVLAARLAEDPKVSVLVIEAGEDMDNSMTVKVLPAAPPALYHGKYDWQLKTVPQVHANGRVIIQVRGRLLGGCSSINGTQYTRGSASNFDQWATTFDNPGWSYKDVLPYFQKSECFTDPSLDPSHERWRYTAREYLPEYDTFQEDIHGTDGPWQVSFHHLHSISKNFIKANLAEGIPRLPDASASPMLGIARLYYSLQVDGVRSSTSRAFLGPKNVPGGGNRGRIRIALKSKVERIIIEEKNGVKKAVGVEFRDSRDVLQRVHANREVLVCSGVFHSPTLLLASGIGYKIHPSIPLVHPLKGVGENLTDPFSVPLRYSAPAHINTVHSFLHAKAVISEVYKYFRHGTGMLTSALIETACFLRLEDISPEFVAREKANGTWQERASGPDAPHLEIMFLPCFVNKFGETQVFPKHGNFYSLIIVLLNPASKGRTTATVNEVTTNGKSEKRYQVEPVIDPNYLADEFDIRAIREGVRFARKLGRRMSKDPELAGVESYPGEEAVPDDDDAALEAYIRQESISSYHSTGTCAMGPASNPEAVVDARLRVHGVDALRVVDASIFPRVLSAHTAAATVMVAEKASDMIKEDWLVKQKLEKMML
ncbi:hypothetical protein BGZ49_008741 [Haplosporangium sp. Z 27]|nr:hypothetical protein BGZ49_008741 [Haplosporangium sp. Z 27]